MEIMDSIERQLQIVFIEITDSIHGRFLQRITINRVQRKLQSYDRLRGQGLKK